MFYTYAHYKPEGGLFYIGKGKRRRAYQLDNRNAHWNNIVAKYGKPYVQLLAKWDTEQEALDHERLLISCFRDMNFKLANICDGGQGTSGLGHPAWNKGLTMPEESRQKLSKSLKGKPAWNAGVPMSDEQKAKISATKKGCVSSRKGVTLSPEIRAKISETKRLKGVANV